MNKKILTALVLLTGFTTIVNAQDTKDYFNPLSFGVPTLTIAPDARSGAMGDVGAATEPDVYSQHWNPAKYAFMYSKAGIGVTYTPWLKKIIDDIYQLYISGFYKLGTEDRHAISASFRYFSIGRIDLTDDNGNVYSDVSPYEMAADVAYSLKLTETFSMAAALRFIYSDLGVVGYDIYPGSAFAGDVSGYYNNYVMLGNSECMVGLGFNVANIGSKISYDNGITNNFLPTTLRLGGSLLMPLDNYNTLSLNLDVNKYMIPTPPDTRTMTPDEKDAAMRDFYAISPVSGIFKSFSDAPGGFKEELQEIRYGLGLEYGYDNKFFVRGGYFYENPNKGNFRYFTLGAGFNMQVLRLDVAYLISTVPSNPLDQTLRFSLSFDMDGLKGLMR
ncbi:MAG: type IX secretion system outer membrane channel protein PorV [Dysgonamonadaceae bacterium]|jgi:hypothetical protein|nr:type IX secretion system outer membrane channel protein PorV [Dysgonamonadaceae bacterium]